MQPSRVSVSRVLESHFGNGVANLDAADEVVLQERQCIGDAAGVSIGIDVAGRTATNFHVADEVAFEIPLSNLSTIDSVEISRTISDNIDIKEREYLDL